jgi:hypothetical protein
MKGIDTRLLRALLFVIFLVVVTNFDYLFGKKKVSEPSPGPTPESTPGPAPEPAPGPAPAPEPPTKEEPSTQTVEAVKTNIFAEVQAVQQLPKAMVKTEGYISYSDI